MTRTMTMMNKTGLAALAAAMMAIPAPALAVTGTVTIDGTVTDKCIVTNIGSTASPDFGGVIHLNDLDDPTTGKLRTISPVSSSSSSELNFRVVCTTATPAVSVTANPLVNGPGTAPSGYAATVHYNSAVAFDIADASPTTVNTNTVTTPTAGTTLPGRLASVGPTNIHVSADTFRTSDINAVLMAGNYAGSIVITVTPT